MLVVCIREYVHLPITTILITVMLTREHSSYTEPDLFSLSTPKMLWLVGFTSGLSALCDVVITIGLSYYLNSKRTGFKRYVLSMGRLSERTRGRLTSMFLCRTNSIINRLIIYAVNRGTLTA